MILNEFSFVSFFFSNHLVHRLFTSDKQNCDGSGTLIGLIISFRLIIVAFPSNSTKSYLVFSVQGRRHWNSFCPSFNRFQEVIVSVVYRVFDRFYWMLFSRFFFYWMTIGFDVMETLIRSWPSLATFGNVFVLWKIKLAFDRHNLK